MSGDGHAIMPMLVLAGKVLMEDWFMGTDLDNDYFVGTSNTGYSNDQLSMEWIQHFHRQTVQRIQGLKQLQLFEWI